MAIKCACSCSQRIAWMCKNLELGWPIDKVEKPDIKKASLIGMECKQAPAVQLGMLKALEDTMEAAAETDEPTWLALLASWLQAMANLRLVHVLRRSVPIELYDGWSCSFAHEANRNTIVLGSTGVCRQRLHPTILGPRSS